jgi:hypothetical protein
MIVRQTILAIILEMVEKDDRIHFFSLKKIVGTVARNKGISNAGGRYISFRCR